MFEVLVLYLLLSHCSILAPNMVRSYHIVNLEKKKLFQLNNEGSITFLQSEYAFRWLNGRILTYLCYKFDTSIVLCQEAVTISFIFIILKIELKSLKIDTCKKDLWLSLFNPFLYVHIITILHWNINVRSWFTVFQTNQNFNLEVLLNIVIFFI